MYRSEGSGAQLTEVWANRVERPAQAHEATTPKPACSPYHRLSEPFSDYIRATGKEVPAGQVAIIPELISTRWYQSFLHNARGTAIKAKL